MAFLTEVVKKGVLIIFSGLPGSGKSTISKMLANRFQLTYLRIDTIEQGLRDICDISQIDGKGYRLTYRIAQENLLCGNTVIADSVNPYEFTRMEWNKVAEDIGADFVNIEIICSNDEEHKKRVENRISSVPGLKQPTWSEVKEREYEPWKGKRLLLDTFNKSTADCLEELVQLLDSKLILKRENEVY